LLDNLAIFPLQIFEVCGPDSEGSGKFWRIAGSTGESWTIRLEVLELTDMTTTVTIIITYNHRIVAFKNDLNHLQRSSVFSVFFGD